MKKLMLSCAVLCFFSSLGAELYIPQRFIEFGVEVSAGASNNLYGVPDILTETITIDLQKVADSLGRNGFVMDAFADANVFFNLNLSEKFRLGFFTNVSGSTYVGIGRGMFDLLASGWDFGEAKKFSATAYGDLFMNVGASFHTTILQNYGITITPTYVVPLAYADNASGNITFLTEQSGTIRATAEASFTVYTAMDMEDFSADDVVDNIFSVMSKGGFDLSFEVERPVLKRLDMGIFGRVPIIPGRLSYKMSRTMWAWFEEENLFNDLLNASGDNPFANRYDYDEGEIEYDQSTKYVFRPFRLGVEAAWRPFGSWCVFRPKLGFAVRHPYSSHAVFYPEYALDAHVTLFKVVGFQFGTAYEDRIFVQRVGLMLNTRIVQIDVKALFRSEDFINSFRLAGAGAYAGVRFGF